MYDEYKMTHNHYDTLTVLAIESSCDETAVAIVEGSGKVVCHEIYSQMELHAAYGGVVPEIASRNHLIALPRIFHKLLKTYSTITNKQIDAIAVTSGPGLIGSVIVGVMFAKGLAAALNKPCIPVNHLVGHALTVRMTHKDVDFPYLLLLVSGGHCQLLVVHGALNYETLGQTRDDAVGEAFDKVAKMLGLGYPGGPIIEEYAKNGDRYAITLPKPFVGSDSCEFSFSGLKTAVYKQIALAKQSHMFNQRFINDVCASFQHTIAEILVDRVCMAIRCCSVKHGVNNFVSTHNAHDNLHTYHQRKQYNMHKTHCELHNTENSYFDHIPTATMTKSFAVAGGVAANTYIRDILENTVHSQGMRFVSPPHSLCTDNAAMIAWAAIEMIRHNPSLLTYKQLDFFPRSRWPLSEVK